MNLVDNHPIVQIENLTFSYGNNTIFKNFNLSLNKGEIVSLVGASGSGKTTLFKLLTGLLTSSCGTIKIHNTNCSTPFSYIAYLMQEDLLLPWRNVLSNLLLIGELGHSPDQPHILKNESLKMLAEVDLEHCAEMFPDELSGGMRQRVGLARALLQKRPILLLDEPFGALDAGLRGQMCNLLRNIQKKYETTILMITHEFRDAISLSDRIFLLDRGQITRHWRISQAIQNNPVELSSLQQELYQALAFGINWKN